MENEKKENEEKVQAKKSNRGMKITIIVLIIIILALAILYAIEILNNDESSDENVVENYIDGNNSIVDNNNNIIDENATYENDIYVSTTDEANITENAINGDTTKNVVSISFTTQKEVYNVEGSSYTVTVAQDFADVYATDSSVERAIQEELDNIANEQFSDYKSQAYDTVCSEDYVVTEDLEIGYIMGHSRIDEKVVSVTNVSYGSLGGTSWSNYSGLSFDATTGEKLTTHNIAIDYTKLVNYIDSKISTYLTTNANELYLYDTENIPSIEECDWYLSDAGLTICFSKYQVSPFTFEYTIPYSELNGYINDEYLK